MTGSRVKESVRASDDVLRRVGGVARWCAARAADRDEDGNFPAEEFRRIAEAGLLGLPLAQTYGGAGIGSDSGRMANLLRTLTLLGWGNLSVGRLYEGHVNALGLIQTFGTPEQVERCASDVRDRGLVFAVWNTEAKDGVRLLPIGGGRYRLEGKKTFASGAGQVERPLLTGALPDGGWQMVVVPTSRTEGRVDPASWHPLGMRASTSYAIDVGGIEVGSDELIGGPGDYYRQPWFGGGAIRFAAVQLGGAAALLDAARVELRSLGRTNDALQRARIGEAAIAVETGLLWLEGAARRADASALGGATDGVVGADEMVMYANMTRTAIERVCLDVLERVERSIGARGMLRPHPIERIGRDLTMYLRQPAPDAVLGEVGRSVLSDESDMPDRLTASGDR